MPESMFGRPSQHLLPSNPPINPSPTSAQPDPQPPLDFKDFRFNSIGKQPELLSRISLPQLEHMDYRTPSPSPTYTPPPNLTNVQPQSSSRRTLFQQLAGSDPGADGSSRWHTSTSQSNGSLASRIQTKLGPSSDVPYIVHRPTNGYPFLERLTGDASLIPPVEVLPQPPDSSPPTPTSFTPTIEPTTAHSPTSSLLIHMTSAQTSRIPSPIPIATTVPGEPKELSSSSPVADDRERSLQLSSTISTVDSLAARHERLQAISNTLAALTPLPSPHSPSPGPSSVIQTNDNPTPPLFNQSQHSVNSAVFLRPLSANQLPSRVGLNVNNLSTDTDHSFPALVQPLIQEYQTQRRVLFEAAQNLNSALDVLHRVHADSENALTHQIQTLQEERAAFEHMKRVDVATLQQQSQELQQKHEELNARESNLALLEKESKAREDARKGMIARRQAQEEEKRAAEAKRIHETKEQVDNALKEVMEVKAVTERTRHQFRQLPVPDDVPAEPQEGMAEEEIAAVKSRNDLLRDIQHLHQLHTGKLQQLEESNCTLRRLEDERKRGQAEEAERRRMLAKVELAHQAQEEKRRQFEAERKRQAIAKGRELAPPLVEEQAHTEAQFHGSKSVEVTSSQTLERCSHPGEVIGVRRPASADTTKVRATREANSLTAATHSTSVDADERTSTSRGAVLLPEIHISPVRPQNATSSKSKNGPVSGGVKLSAPTPKLHGGGHLPPKPLSGPSPLPSSDRATDNALNLPRPSSPTPMSVEGGHRLSFPDQLAAEFNRISDEDVLSTLDHRPFPRTQKSQTIFDATNGGSQELDIGPAPGVSPTHQNINLRHLKRSRGRVEENDSGDRSVRTINVKNEETLPLSVKKEEADDNSGELAPASALLASLPPRPAVIPPPRPWKSRKRHAASQSQTNSINSSPLESNKNLTREVVTTADEQPRDAPPLGSSQISRAMNAPVQRPVPAEISDSLLLGPVNSGLHSSETRINTGGRPIQDAENRGSSSESATATLSHGLNGEDLPRNNRRFTDEPRRGRKGNDSRRVLNHYSPPSVAPRAAAVSPTQPHRTTDWYPPTSTNGPRAEPMRATSPTTGRKRPSEFSDNEHGHRARRQRSDVWIAQEHDRSRVDYRRPDPELDERRTAYRTPPTPDRIRAYPSDMQRMAYDNRTYVSPPPDKPMALPPRLEQSYRRPDHDDVYRYQPPTPGYHAVADQYHDTRVGQTYEPMAEERMNDQTEPPLLARMSTSQRVPVIVV